MTQDKALEILKSGANVFLTGEPGSGKSFTIGRFVEWMNTQNRPYAITASTGIAASQINGSTIHSWAGIGIRRGISQKEAKGMTRSDLLQRKLGFVQTLVIDEVSMIDAVTLQDLDTILKEFRDPISPFGGVQIVLVGDFFQLPPVSRDGSSRFAFESPAWDDAELAVCYLTEQHRQSDPTFLDILSAMRRGQVSDAQKSALAATSAAKPDTQLFTHNVDVDALNESELAKLTTKEKIYHMSESGIPALCGVLKRNCLSPEHLKLKVGAVVMLTRNNFKEGYVNGSIGKVISLNGDPIVKLLNGKEVCPERAEWTFVEYGKQKAAIQQIPLRLAWAVTVHKSQGMTLDAAEIDLSRAFEFGQGYVAISRVRSLQGLRIRGMNERTFEVHPLVVERDLAFRAASAKLEKMVQ